VKVSWVAGDAIHDNRKTRSFLKSIGTRAFIDRNPRRAGKGKAKPTSRTYRRMKASMERSSLGRRSFLVWTGSGLGDSTR
jgi:hypothetical protein